MKLGLMVCYCAARTGLRGQLLGLRTQCCSQLKPGGRVPGRDAWILTDEIELSVYAMKNFLRTSSARKPLGGCRSLRVLRVQAHSGRILSDRPTSYQDSLPPSLLHHT